MRILEAAKKAKSNSSSERESQYFYYPELDAVKNGSAVIRFLPGNGDEIPFVKYYTHGFKSATGKWLIENCPTSIGDPCPVCEANTELYSTLTKDEARKYGMNRKTHFVFRILVVEDKKTPDNEGKIFLYQCGTKVFDKIMDAMSPSDEDETPLEVFDLKKGANFKLKIRKVDGQINYDKSTFDAPSICKVNIEYTAENDIQKFVAKDSYKAYDDLQKRLNMVVGNTTRVQPVKEVGISKAPKEEAAPRTFGESSKDIIQPTKLDAVKGPVGNPEGDDDILAMMQKLVEDDDIPF